VGVWSIRGHLYRKIWVLVNEDLALQRKPKINQAFLLTQFQQAVESRKGGFKGQFKKGIICNRAESNTRKKQSSRESITGFNTPILNESCSSHLHSNVECSLEGR